jgi:NAD(P)-dependent dehydrogenase (short-subunit alcohol dehydrogenase family)
MFDRPITTVPPPITRNKRAAREGLWALTCFLAVAALDITVISNAHGGPHSGLLNIPSKAWADVWDAVLAGHFWIATGALYGLLQIIRLTAWAVRTTLRRADSKRTVPQN